MVSKSPKNQIFCITDLIEHMKGGGKKKPVKEEEEEDQTDSDASEGNLKGDTKMEIKEEEAEEGEGGEEAVEDEEEAAPNIIEIENSAVGFISIYYIHNSYYGQMVYVCMDTCKCATGHKSKKNKRIK